MLQPRHRLRHSADVQRVRRQGRSWRHSLVVFLLMPNDRPVSRFAFIASRRIGNAVARNRVKRLMREAVRVNLAHVLPGWDGVFIARSPLAQADFADVEVAVRQLLRRAGVWLESEPQG